MSVLLPGGSVEPPSSTLVGLKQTMVHKVNDVKFSQNRCST